MNVACVFSIDDAYVMPFQVFFHSLDATMSIPAKTRIFILHSEALAKASIQKLTSFLEKYGRLATFLDASKLIPPDLPIRKGDHVSPATFYRLFIAEILPVEIDQAVYLDVDILSLRSVEFLFNNPVDGLVAAVDHFSPAMGIRLWGDCSGDYFQAGVLVIPLNLWRQQSMASHFLEIMAAQQSRIVWWDQDVLNIALRDRWQRLPIWFNVCEAVLGLLSTAEIEQHGALIHYTGNKKPWNALRPSPFTEHWDRAYAAAFGVEFDRSMFLPPRRIRLKAAIRSTLSRLLNG